MSDPLLEQLLAGFVDEAEEIAARLTLNLLELERRGGGRSFDDLARGLHTLKGSAATLGLDALSELAHRMEDALLPLRGRPGPLPAPIADAQLRALDTFLAQLRFLAGRAPEPRDLSAALSLLEQAERAIANAPEISREAVRTDPGRGEVHRLEPSRGETGKTETMRRPSLPRVGMETLRGGIPESVRAQMAEAARNNPPETARPLPMENARTSLPEAARPQIESARSLPNESARALPLEGARTFPPEPARTLPPGAARTFPPELSRSFAPEPFAHPLPSDAEPMGRLRSEPMVTPSPPIAHAALDSQIPHPASVPPSAQAAPLLAAPLPLAAFDSEGPRPTEEGWRVGARQVVGLLLETERLRELRLRIDERRREVERALTLLTKHALRTETAEARALLTTSARSMSADSEEAADVLAQLEEGLKAITTLPVRTVIEPLRRALRDLCRQQGKEARLAVVGAEVSLDRRVLEGLRGTLVQLVRNAVDHGLESPGEREAAGKHREGAITIRVEQQGNMLFIELADDGHGLDVSAIREAALERGVATPEELALLNESQLQQLIFRPGLTTRAQVTELSGRGVGLDVARAQLQALRGQIEAHSVPGQGTRFLLTLPADLGSSPVLVVRVGEHLFGVPMAAIESSRAARGVELRTGRGRTQLEHREQLIELHDLGALLGLRQASVPEEGTPLLVLLRHGTRLAIAVDEVIGDKELLIRALPPEVREIPAWQGAATLARGELILVLRADWLVQAIAEEPRALTTSRRALVVDDSLTARALHRTALESGGWHVHTASSGEQALERLKQSSYDVLIADIGMTPMDGLMLTQSVRGQQAGAALPIILVSAHDGASDRERGREAGADGFLSKRDCASGRLLTEVAAVIARRKGAA